ncbi:D-amino acid dehydrogenase [Massilia psychrophila]|uniref:Amino acid dehydrogenase n=1 Tax=Massilia psychrophila TaxID=1603353 RepID=A0A2G8T161_9BURK|nr:D-amino acid dehydrogenase [Massilia psychrophila]PIL39776.1 amino acid dehydrogenase [Massilia psychrophila]GGE63280.1 D-amino acid dehydrogenase small subunit [Massilia psychrophila]
MKVIVLGAGVIGTASAWYLRRAGIDVTVIERQGGAALETSFANGGQISVSHAQPWANPATLLKVLADLGREDAPLLFRLRADPVQWRWCLQFVRECLPGRVAANLRRIVAIAEDSRRCLQELRFETGIEFDSLSRGILHFYTDQREFDKSQGAAAAMRELGCPRNPISADEVVRIEPALSNVRAQLVGGDFTASDESGDAFAFTSQLAAKGAAGGIEFCYNTTVTRLLNEGGKVSGVEIIDGVGRHQVLRADAFVVALGSFSAPLLAPLGVKLLIYPGKGYSATYRITDPDAAPTVSLTDDGHKLVLSRLGLRLRVAGTCELNGYSRELNPVRCEAITRRVRALFPGACDYDDPTYWAGLRPLTPSNVPYIGTTRYPNLFLNTGHGTLGWTMACGSGRAIAEIVSGRRP